MTEDEGCNKEYKLSSISQTSKRSKLTLSLKSNSLLKSSHNCKTGQIFTGTLQDGLLKLPTGSICECSPQDVKTCTGTCHNRTNALCETDPNNVLINIKSDSVKLEDTARVTYSKSNSSDSFVGDTKVIKPISNSGYELKEFSDDNINKCSRVGNFQDEDIVDLNCSFQATCHTVASIATSEVVRTEGNDDGPNLVERKEMLIKLDTNESDSTSKVEAWLCKRGISDDLGLEDKCIVDNSELKTEREPSVVGTEQKVSSEFFSDGNAQDDPADKVLQCPVCWKKLNKNVTSHLKLCAAKHKVTTQQLLEALELQRRQTEERRALGLPAVGATGTSKKSSASRKGSSTGDANLQLALALSASLQEAEEHEQDILLEAGMAEPASLSPSVIQRQLSLLEKYGFTSSRPAVPHSRQKTSLSKARLKSYPLLNRTKEERERLITEKVAIVLMGEEDVEQAQPCIHDKWQDFTAITSDLLLKFQDKENQLWEMARDTSADVNKDVYYVQSLASHISPCKVEPGTKLKHLSQIQGRINTPKKSANSKEMKMNGSRVVFSEVSLLKQRNDKMEKLRKVKKLLDFSPEMKSSPCAVKSSVKKQQNSHSSSLSEDWASVMNKQAMSDITIHVSGGREIPAHKLVFYARCPALLYDLIKEESNGTVRELLMWVDVSYNAALAFLEFLYCGTMNRILRLGDDVSCLKTLAKHYQVMDVVQHLEVMHKVRAHVSNDGGYSSNASINSAVFKEDHTLTRKSILEANALADSRNRNCLLNERSPGCRSPSCEVQSACLTPTVQKNTPLSEERFISQCTSPDIFDDECATEGSASQGSRASVDCLLSLMNKGNINGSDKSGEMDVICCESRSLSVGFVTKKRKINADLANGSCVNIFPVESSVDGKLKFSDVGSFPEKILIENKSSQTNVSVSKNIPLTPDTKRKNSISSTPEINTVQLPTLDLTQDSSDEDQTQHKTAQNEIVDKCAGNNTPINSVFVGEELCSSRTRDTCSGSRHVDGEILESKQETLRNTDCDACSEPNVTFVDNVWDDFDDLGVVPNLSFYSSPSHNHEVFGTTRNSVQKSLSPNVKLSPLSCLSQGSSDEHHRSKVKKQSKASMVAAKLVSPNCEASPCRGTSLTTVSGTPRKVDCSFKRLLDDSLADNWNSSALWRGECEERQNVGQSSSSNTPDEPVKTASDRVTPMPDYSMMKTPLLKKELFRYGLKPLKRKHAKQILRHIYNEMHPFVDKEDSAHDILALPTGSQSSKSLFKEPGPDTVVPKSPGKRLSSTPSPKKLTYIEASSKQSDSDCEDLSQSSTCSSVSSDSCMAEEMIFEMDMLSQADPDSAERDSTDFRKAVHQYIISTPELYEKILQYEPIWLEELQADLKAQKIKFNIKQLMDYLDEQCVTFRTKQGQQSRARRKERKRKSSSTLSQPSRGRLKKKSCTQPS